MARTLTTERAGPLHLQDYYELGVILTRKKLYTQATKNLEKARKTWDGEESELAQARCLLGRPSHAAAAQVHNVPTLC
jgi:hypothetical protein